MADATEECFRFDGVPIVFWAGAVMALCPVAEAVAGAGACANARPGARNTAANRPESRWILI